MILCNSECNYLVVHSKTVTHKIQCEHDLASQVTLAIQ
jgi:hypothetical protein